MKNLILETQKINKQTYLLVTGSHLSPEFGRTYEEIKKDNFRKNNHIVTKYEHIYYLSLDAISSPQPIQLVGGKFLFI